MAEEFSLEQLKAENAKAEAKANPTPQKGETEDETEAVEAGSEDLTGAETGEDTEDTTDIDAWMQSDEDESDTEGHDSEKKFTDSDVAAAKRNMRAKLDKKHQKREQELLDRIEALEKGQSPAAKPVTGAAAKPKREDFNDDDAFEDALIDWKLAAREAKRDAEEQRRVEQRKVKEFEDATNSAVDSHYERAAELAQKSGISADQYKAADLKVREMVEEVFPDGGDAVTDNMIAMLGKGSEKVMFNLGINKKRLGRLRELLTEDRSGLKAATYLGQLKVEIGLPGKRRTEPPAPAGDVKGDSKGSESVRALKRKYDAAHKRGDSQAAFDIRREARQAGANITNW